MGFRSRFARFLYGRYGSDQLYTALFISELICLFLGALLSVLGQIHPVFTFISVTLYFLSIGLFIWTIFRCFSRNIPARRRENEAYLRFKMRIKHPFKKAKSHHPQDTATHIFRTCRHCKANLRLPRQVGKHTVKCPRCGERFKVKVKK